MTHAAERDDTPATGGCQCGRVRFSADAASARGSVCHCRMCRRATGGAWAAFVELSAGSVTWTAAKPERFASSPIATRPFCSACGTQLGFQYNDSERLDLLLGAFDAPERFHPYEAFAVEYRLSGWSDLSGLTERRMADHHATTDRWIAATGAIPE